MRRHLFSTVALIVLCAQPDNPLHLHAEAQTLVAASLPSYSAEAEIASALYAASATQEAAQRVADARIRELMREIDGLRQTAERAQATSGTNRAAAEAARLDLARAEERFVAELAARDQVYARQIAVFRAGVEDITSTPEGLEALAIFNGGDRIGALTILKDLRAAEDAAEEAGLKIRSAARARPIAALALETRNKGELATADLISLYEEITELDPSVHWDWVELGRLYMAAGRLVSAAHAAQKATETARDDRDRSVAFDALGDVLFSQGYEEAALQAYRQSLAISDRLAHENPLNVDLQRDRSVLHIKIGDVLLSLGDLEGVVQAYNESIAIVRGSQSRQGWNGPVADRRERADIGIRLVHEDELTSAWRRQRSITMGRLRASLSTADLSGDAPAPRPEEVDWRLNRAVSLARIGDILLAQGDYGGAMRTYNESLALKEQLAVESPDDTQLLRNRSVTIEKLGDVFRLQGNSEEAQTRYSDSLDIIERLAKTDRSNASWQRDLLILNVKIGSASNDRAFLLRALSIIDVMKSEGSLTERDFWIDSELRRLVQET